MSKDCSDKVYRLLRSICWEIMGATSYTQRKNKKTKIPDSQKDVRRRAKIGAQKSAKHKTAYRDCVT